MCSYKRREDKLYGRPVVGFMYNSHEGQLSTVGDMLFPLCLNLNVYPRMGTMPSCAICSQKRRSSMQCNSDIFFVF